SSFYPDDNSAIMRSGWTQQDLYLRFGADSGVHAHPDHLDVTVYGYGRKLIPGMGANTYGDDLKSRWLRRSTEAHSTIEINGKAQLLQPSNGLHAWLSNPHYDFSEGSTSANLGFLHTRSVLFIK